MDLKRSLNYICATFPLPTPVSLNSLKPHGRLASENSDSGQLKPIIKIQSEKLSLRDWSVTPFLLSV